MYYIIYNTRYITFTMETIPIEIFFNICLFLDNKNLCNIRLLSKKYNTFILNYGFNNKITLETQRQYNSFILFLKNNKNMNKIKIYIRLKSYFINSNYMYNNLKYFKNCLNLDLSDCNVADENLKYLSNCKILKLYGCNISEEYIQFLKNKGIEVYHC